MRTSMKGQPVEVYKVSMPGRSWVRNMVTDFIDWAPKDDSGITVRDSLSKSGIWQVGGAPSLEGRPAPRPYNRGSVPDGRRSPVGRVG